MKRNRAFLYNTLLLTATAVLMRVIGLLFQIFLSNKIGAAGIGLFQLIMSVSVFALLMPIMYLDTVTDGMLQSLRQHMYSMYFNITDSFLCVLLVLFLLSRYAVWDYIAILYISEIFNFTLSVIRLSRVTKLYFEPRVIVKSIIAGAGGASVSRAALYALRTPVASAFVLGAAFLLSSMVYIILLRALSALSEDDRAWKYRVFRIKKKIKTDEK